MQYYVFCAIAVLYVCIIRKLSPTHHWHAHLRTVDRCQRLLSQHALQASFARRYAIFLGELRVEAEKKVEVRSRGGGSDDVVMEEPHMRDREVEIHQQQQQQQQDSTTTPFEMEEVDAATVSSLFDELTNWEELDSFVSFIQISYHQQSRSRNIMGIVRLTRLHRSWQASISTLTQHLHQRRTLLERQEHCSEDGGRQ